MPTGPCTGQAPGHLAGRDGNAKLLTACWFQGGREQAEGAGLLTPCLLPNSQPDEPLLLMWKGLRVKRGGQKPLPGEMAAAQHRSSTLGMNAPLSPGLVWVLQRPRRAWARSDSSPHPRWLGQGLAHARSSVHVLLFFSPHHCLYCSVSQTLMAPKYLEANHTHSMES